MSNAALDRSARAAIYREAARLFEVSKVGDTGQGACCAIAQAALPRKNHHDAYDDLVGTPIIADYCKLFRPEFGGGYWGLQWGASNDEVEECRILALCFMAAMVEAGDV